MRIGGFDFLPDGRIALSTLIGDVWLVDGIDDQLKRLRWKRIAAGLNQPLGLVVQHGKILVLGRDQLTRLHDFNGDDEADYYECMTLDFPTAGGDGFATSLNQDSSGTLYWFTYSHDFGVTRFEPTTDSPPTAIATGLRGTNGIGVSADGRIVLASVQEGTWTPATAIFEVRPGSYHGLMGPRREHGPDGYDLPLCFVPRGIDNSAGEMAVLPNDRRLGPLAGHIIGTSFGYCQHYLILRESLGSRVQGGIVPLSGEFLSGAHRLRFQPRDGCLYVAGTDGWQSYAQAPGSLQRLRYTGRSLPLPRRIETRANGLILHFDSAINPNSVKLDRVFCEQWNYLYSAAYGSPEYSVRQPGQRGHDRVDVKSLHLLPDGRSLFVEIPTLHPVMQLHLYTELATSDGMSFPVDLYYSIFHLGELFTSFPGYQSTAKASNPPFPTATSYPRDQRLVRQEDLGKDFSTLQGITSLHVDAVGGLRYEPNVLRVPPGRRVALVVRNVDAGMPHNWVLVRPERLDSIGQQAMRLAADPQAFATHYVPHDDGVLALSPIVNPHDQYTVYFDSPRERGAYPFLCTFPGHWQVMRGMLYVLDDDQPLPADVPIAEQRKFVRDWQLTDLAADAEALSQRSYQSGHLAYHIAGCAQCHAIAGHGATWGPDLTTVHERFRGAKLLEQILEPSSEINKSYQTVVVQRRDGTVVSGLLIHENEHHLTLLPNPLLPHQVIAIEHGQVDQRDVSPQSTMPTGLLATLTRDEILDLLAFLTAGAATGARRAWSGERRAWSGERRAESRRELRAESGGRRARRIASGSPLSAPSSPLSCFPSQIGYGESVLGCRGHGISERTLAVDGVRASDELSLRRTPS
jgi:putative heme-binding domain-containing protein